MTFQFTPSDGYRNTVSFPTKPANETAFRDSMQDLLDQVKDEINTGSSSPIGIRNIAQQALINGNFDIWQRGSTFNNPNGIYHADRFYIANSVDSNVKILRTTTVPNAYSKYSLRAEVMTTISAGGYSDISQAVEDFNLFAGKQVTLSGYIKCDAGASVTPRIEDPSVIVTGSTISSTSWTPFTVTGTVTGANTSLKIVLRFSRNGLGIGTGINIAQLQLSIGTAIPFQPRGFGDELTLCQRYYEKSYDYNVAPGTISSVGQVGFGALSAVQQQVHVRFLSKKRVSPTVLTYDPVAGGTGGSGTSGKYYVVATGSQTDGNINNVGDGGFSFLTPNVTAQTRIFHFTADAEI